jgi:hypothetical protein
LGAYDNVYRVDQIASRADACPNSFLVNSFEITFACVSKLNARNKPRAAAPCWTDTVPRDTAVREGLAHRYFAALRDSRPAKNSPRVLAEGGAKAECTGPTTHDKGALMNTNLKKLATSGAAAVAVAVPAALFVGAGTAQAALPAVSYTNDGIGTVAHVSDPNNPPGAIEFCNYSSHVAGNPFLFPFFSPVQLSGKTASDLQILGIQTGTLYDVTVSCPVGGTVTFQQNY